jgi:dTDP-4-dehydrorhamnose 3,5-epimerase
MMQITTTPLAGVLVITPKVHSDTRGYFLETFQQEHYTKQGMPPFVQDNMSRSKRHVLRGLHFQSTHAQGKLVWATRGEVWDVAVDVRQSSATFGKWFGILLNDENHLQLYIPPGFAHGFCVLSEEADFSYKCTDFYAPGAEHGIVWNDPALNIAWPIENPILSSKDAAYPSLHELPHEHLFA